MLYIINSTNNILLHRFIIYNHPKHSLCLEMKIEDQTLLIIAIFPVIVYVKRE